MKDKKFIIWDSSDGAVRYGNTESDDAEKIISDGLTGRLSEDNVYLTTYAGYPGALTHTSLEVGECIKGVRFTLSGENALYDVYRVH